MKTTEEFIRESKGIHGDKYDYSKTEYNGAFKKVCIICPEHGEFWQTPHDHLRGCGCKGCANDKSSKERSCGVEEFIKKAKKVHGDFYDYSKVNYINAKTKVCIICPEHGEFWQTPDKHLQGCGCNKCRYIKSSNKKRKTKEWFINEAKKIHGDKYDYSKVDYYRRDKNVCIICPEHGEFWQHPGNHLQGHGCPSCGGSKKYSQEEFIRKAVEIHGDKYDYSKVEYKNMKTKVCIICPEHGEFWQTASCHIHRRQGCPVCDESHLERDVRNLLLLEKINFTQEYNRPWLGKQVLDFYLPDYKIAIECQGEGHFSPVRFNGISLDVAKKNYINAIRLDEEKKKKCLKNGVKILYYSDLKIKYPYKVITEKNELLKKIKDNE